MYNMPIPWWPWEEDNSSRCRWRPSATQNSIILIWSGVTNSNNSYLSDKRVTFWESFSRDVKTSFSTNTWNKLGDVFVHVDISMSTLWEKWSWRKWFMRFSVEGWVFRIKIRLGVINRSIVGITRGESSTTIGVGWKKKLLDIFDISCEVAIVTRLWENSVVILPTLIMRQERSSVMDEVVCLRSEISFFWIVESVAFGYSNVYFLTWNLDLYIYVLGTISTMNLPNVDYWQGVVRLQ